MDQGIHMGDLMLLFAGAFTEVYSFISNSRWGHNVEDNAYAMMRTSDGIVCMLNSSATQWRHQFYLDINLERGSLILGGILSGTKSYGAETLTVVRADPDNITVAFYSPFIGTNLQRSSAGEGLFEEYAYGIDSQLRSCSIEGDDHTNMLEFFKRHFEELVRGGLEQLPELKKQNNF